MHYFFDSGFPSGALAHSFGFETFCARFSSKSLYQASNWIKNYMYFSLWHGDLENFSRCYELLDKTRTEDYEKQQVKSLVALDKQLHVTRTTAESRQAQESLTKALMRSSAQFFDAPDISVMSAQFQEPSTLLGILANKRQWDMSTTRVLFLMRELVMLTSVLVRYGKIGQSQQLTIISDLTKTAAALARERPSFTRNAGSRASIEVELDQIDHTHLTPRLFQS